MEGVTTGASICCFPCCWLDSSPFTHLLVFPRHLRTWQARQFIQIFIRALSKTLETWKNMQYVRECKSCKRKWIPRIKITTPSSYFMQSLISVIWGRSRDGCWLMAANPATWSQHGQSSKFMNMCVYVVSTQTETRNFSKTWRIVTLQILW